MYLIAGSSVKFLLMTSVALERYSGDSVSTSFQASREMWLTFARSRSYCDRRLVGHVVRLEEQQNDALRR
jgi:hypothetical protein